MKSEQSLTFLNLSKSLKHTETYAKVDNVYDVWKYIPTLANRFAASSAFRVAAAQPSLWLGFAGYSLRTLLSSSLLPALKQKKHPFFRMSVFCFMVGPESLLYSYSCKQVCCEQCLSRRSGSTFAVARFCRLSASNSLIEFASSGFKTKKHPFLRMSVFCFMVGPERIELSRHCCHQILSLARLPIPPQPHKNYTTLIQYIF